VFIATVIVFAILAAVPIGWLLHLLPLPGPRPLPSCDLLLLSASCFLRYGLSITLPSPAEHAALRCPLVDKDNLTMFLTGSIHLACSSSCIFFVILIQNDT
jgi:hypothetical protein